MQLSQAETVGPPDDHGVRPRDVQATFDDIGRQQDISLTLGEADHNVVDHVRRQIAVGDLDREFWRQGSELISERRDVLDPWRDHETMTAASPFPEQRGWGGGAPTTWAPPPPAIASRPALAPRAATSRESCATLTPAPAKRR